MGFFKQTSRNILPPSIPSLRLRSDLIHHSNVFEVSSKRLNAVGPTFVPQLESEHPVLKLLQALPDYKKQFSFGN